LSLWQDAKVRKPMVTSPK